MEMAPIKFKSHPHFKDTQIWRENLFYLAHLNEREDLVHKTALWHTALICFTSILDEIYCKRKPDNPVC